MSLAYQKLEPVCAEIPQIRLGEDKFFAVRKGPKQNYFKQWTTNTFSNNSVTWSLPPNSNTTVIDRKMWVYIPLRLTLRCVSTGVGQYLLNSEEDAPRQFMSSIFDTVNLSINQNSTSINVAEIIHPLSKFNVDEDLEQGFWSISNSYPDQSQQYSQLVGSARNPLGLYGETSNQNCIPRGGAGNYVIVSQTIVNGGNQPSTAVGETLETVIDLFCCEPLFFMYPMLSGKKEGAGLLHVNSMDLTINFLANAATRVWSRSEAALALTSSSLVIGGATSFSNKQPTVFANYYTLQDTQLIPRDSTLSYPYFNILRYTTEVGSVNALGTGTKPSNSIQLASIPKKLFIFIREKNSDLFANSNRTDSFFKIDKINISYQNQTGILSSASQEQLYLMSRKNGCNLSWAQWSGQPVYNGSPQATAMRGVGSIVCCDFVEDICLESPLDAPGRANVNSTLQIEVTYQNVSNRTIDATLYLVVVNEGTYMVNNNIATTNVGVLTANDVLNCQKRGQTVPVNDLEGNYGDGILDDISDFFKKSKLISTVGKALSNIPGPVGMVAGPVGEFANALGYGGEELKRDKLKAHAKRKVML